ncbi:serine/threonine protein kinase [Streptomyces longisporoflavus]|uniref:serine/threonine-protein kinase n=1 Tax=Streptomyces longisporoflavus TaxID=28044 RepID=UPI00167E1E81|nr:serine/threonine-protein kinase [Streptomyces longisporoflavus]GGV54686.1 serine/threonine protein kinase [Streptomyces longisporoflavus]
MSLRGGDPAEIGGYPLEARLGSGGMGTVFLARTASGRPVAIKLIHQQYAGDEEFRIRFRQEVAAARRVSGAFTAAVVDADPEAEHPWMATTYIEGHTLAQHIAKKGPLTGTDLRTLAIGLTEALRDIHRVGVVHRDLKPSNVVLSPEGPRVIDFGISRAADQQTLTMTGRVIGTPPFMSPEQLQAPRGVGPRSDVFSLGTLLVYAATGQGPFDADSPYMTAYQVVHEPPELTAVPAALRAVVEPCLDKDPDARPSADELLERLRDLPAEMGDVAAGAPGSRTRDTDTQHHRAGDDGTANGFGADTDTGTGTSTGTGAPADGTLNSVRRRRRWRPVLAAAVAVAALGGGVAALQLGSSDTSSGSGDGDGRDSTVAAAEAPPLPDGFRPWRTTVPNDRGIPDEVRCVPRGDALFCGGGGVVATRLRISDGKEIWKVKSPGVPTQGMHIVGATNDTVLGYRVPEGDGAGQQLVALDARTSKELWSRPIGGQSTVYTGRTQDAVLSGSTVLSVDPGRTRIEAREAHSGRVLWSTPFPAGSECTPVAAGQRMYAMCGPSAEVANVDVRHPVLHTVDLESGSLGKGIPVQGPVHPVGDSKGGLVLLHQRMRGAQSVGYDKVLRVDPASGQVSSRPLKKTYDATPGMADGTVYFAGRTGRISAVDPANGREKWSRQTSVEGASGPVLAAGAGSGAGSRSGSGSAGSKALYFSSASGRVVALSVRGGEPLWSTSPRADGLGGEVNASPRIAVSGRVVVVTAAKNTVFTFDATKPPKSG